MQVFLNGIGDSASTSSIIGKYPSKATTQYTIALGINLNITRNNNEKEVTISPATGNSAGCFKLFSTTTFSENSLTATLTYGNPPNTASQTIVFNISGSYSGSGHPTYYTSISGNPVKVVNTGEDIAISQVTVQIGTNNSTINRNVPSLNAPSYDRPISCEIETYSGKYPPETYITLGRIKNLTNPSNLSITYKGFRDGVSEYISPNSLGYFSGFSPNIGESYNYYITATDTTGTTITSNTATISSYETPKPLYSIDASPKIFGKTKGGTSNISITLSDTENFKCNISLPNGITYNNNNIIENATPSMNYLVNISGSSSAKTITANFTHKQYSDYTFSSTVTLTPSNASPIITELQYLLYYEYPDGAEYSTYNNCRKVSKFNNISAEIIPNVEVDNGFYPDTRWYIFSNSSIIDLQNTIKNINENNITTGNYKIIGTNWMLGSINVKSESIGIKPGDFYTIICYAENDGNKVVKHIGEYFYCPMPPNIPTLTIKDIYEKDYFSNKNHLTCYINEKNEWPLLHFYADNNSDYNNLIEIPKELFKYYLKGSEKTMPLKPEKIVNGTTESGVFFHAEGNFTNNTDEKILYVTLNGYNYYNGLNSISAFLPIAKNTEYWFSINIEDVEGTISSSEKFQAVTVPGPEISINDITITYPNSYIDPRIGIPNSENSYAPSVFEIEKESNNIIYDTEQKNDFWIGFSIKKPYLEFGKVFIIIAKNKNSFNSATSIFDSSDIDLSLTESFNLRLCQFDVSLDEAGEMKINTNYDGTKYYMNKNDMTERFSIIDYSNDTIEFKLNIKGFLNGLPLRSKENNNLRNFGGFANQIIQSFKNNINNRSDYNYTISIVDEYSSGEFFTFPINFDYRERPKWDSKFFDIGINYGINSNEKPITYINSDTSDKDRLINYKEKVSFKFPKGIDLNNKYLSDKITINNDREKDIRSYRFSIAELDTIPTKSDYENYTYNELIEIKIRDDEGDISNPLLFSDDFYVYDYELKNYNVNKFLVYKIEAIDSEELIGEPIYSDTYLIGSRLSSPEIKINTIEVESTNNNTIKTIKLDYIWNVSSGGSYFNNSMYTFQNYNNLERDIILRNDRKVKLILQVSSDPTFPQDNEKTYELETILTNNEEIFKYNPYNTLKKQIEINCEDRNISLGKKFIRFKINYPIGYKTYSDNKIYYNLSDYGFDNYSNIYTFFSKNPTVAYRKNHLGINTNSFNSDDLLVITQAEDNRKMIRINGYDPDTTREFNITIDLTKGSVDGLVIDCGEW